MSKLLLTGKLDHYLFDPQNDSTLLKRNGKFGDVYAGVSVPDKKMVVIKHLSRSLKSQPLAIAQFRLEAEMQIEHPALRKTFEYIETGGEHFLVQEYLTAADLKSFFKAEKKYKGSILFILNCIMQVLDALEYLHSKNIIHCDIKPANILIKENVSQDLNYKKPEIKLIDLGQAKTPGSDFVNRVKPFSMIYSPPEQVLHFTDLINPSSDLYALGITMYELIAGKNPFGTPHPEMLMHMQVSGDISENKNIPGELFKIIQKAAAKDKFPLPPNQMNKEDQKKIVMGGMQKRFQTAGEMKMELGSFLNFYNENRKSHSTWFK